MLKGHMTTMLCLFVHCLYLLYGANGLAVHGSHYGKEFYLGMPTNSLGNYVVLYLDIASTANGTLHVSAPFQYIDINMNFTKGRTNIRLGDSTEASSNFHENRGIYLTTTVNVAVYVTSYSSVTTDTYLALPSHVLGQKYIASSYTPASNEQSEIMVVGVKPDTNLTIKFTNGAVRHAHMKRLDTYQMFDSRDLTGTIIEADKPVAVITGATCIQINGSCDMIMTQLIPMDTLDNVYIVPPTNINHQDKSLVRLINTDISNNNICIRYNQNASNVCNSSLPQQVTSRDFGVTPITVTASNPVAVVLYKSRGPFSTIVPGINQYLSEYSFAIPAILEAASFISYMAVIIPKISANGLQMDGQAPTNLIKTFQVPEPFRNYIINIYGITNEYHIIKHVGGIPFGVICFGSEPNTEEASYGFPAGIQLGGQTQTGHGVNTTTTTTQAPIQTSNRMCFSCADLSHLSLCDTVKLCTDNQICSIERFEQHGRTTYRSGCIDIESCPASTNTTSSRGSGDTCVECCTSDFCNHNGCGDSGLPDRYQRGPMCYDCQHVATPDECVAVRPCHADQVCGIEKQEWAGYFQYKMGCTSLSCAPLHVEDESSEVSRRATPMCRSCCADDFCNRNCTDTTLHGSQPIIG